MTEANSSKICGKCKEVQPLVRFNKNKNRPDGLAWDCKECNRTRCQKHFLNNPEKYAIASKEDYVKNRSKYIAGAKVWSLENKEKRKEISKRYVKKNPEARYATQTNNRLANPGMYIAHGRQRLLRKRNALPAWADLKAIEAFYIESARITKETGIKHHVDHYYPLTSDIVCGLHNEFNLRIITATENLSKANRFPEEIS